jgi:hypothetical protein
MAKKSKAKKKSVKKKAAPARKKKKTVKAVAKKKKTAKKAAAKKVPAKAAKKKVAAKRKAAPKKAPAPAPAAEPAPAWTPAGSELPGEQSDFVRKGERGGRGPHKHAAAPTSQAPVPRKPSSRFVCSFPARTTQPAHCRNAEERGAHEQRIWRLIPPTD